MMANDVPAPANAGGHAVWDGIRGCLLRNDGNYLLVSRLLISGVMFFVIDWRASAI